MHAVIINGSHRKNSQSSKVAHYVAGAWGKLDSANTSDIIDLMGNPLPLWDDDFWKPDGERVKLWAPYSERLKKAEALVIVSPEWHGMVPAGLKNFFTYWHAKEVGHKPALIVAVSATRGGSYPVNELRTSGYKNSRVLYIPEHILVQNAEKVLNAEVGDKDDTYIRDRIDYALKILDQYGKALVAVRASGVTFDKRYSNGM
jgi:NAD(P)H-dependent FMN reductase